MAEPADRTEEERQGAQDDERAAQDEGDRRDVDRDAEQGRQATDRDEERERADRADADERDREDADRAEQDEDKADQDEDRQKKTDAEKEEQEKKKDGAKKKDDAAKATDEAEKDKNKKKDERSEEGEKRGQESKPGAPGAPVLGVEGAQPTLGESPMTGGMAPDAAPMGAGGAEPVREDRAEAFAEDPQGPLARHGLLDRPGRPEDARPEEEPLDVEPAATEEVAAPEPPLEPPEAAAERAEREAGDDKPPPDPLPKTDLDVSRVPTADEELRLPPTGEPPRPREAPGFPAPPPVEAEPEQREQADAEDRRAGDDPELRAAEGETTVDRRVDAEAAEAARAPEDEGAAERASEAAGQERAGGVAGEGPAPAPEQPPSVTAEPDGVASPESAEAGVPDVAGEPGRGPVAVGFTEQPATGMPGMPGPAEPVPGGPDMAASAGGGAAAFETAEMPGGAGASLPQDASLEPGGGSCAGGAPPTTEGAEQGGEGAPGGGCGGGGAPPPPAQEEEAAAASADVSSQEPQAALVTVGRLPPARMPQALGGVDQSVNRTVGAEQRDLQQSPPETARPSGAPQTQAGPPQSAPPVESKLVQLTEVTPQTLAERREAEPPPAPGGPNPADQVQAPNVAGNTEGQATDVEVQNMQNAVDGVPTSDPRLHQTVGPAPTVKLEGETDPALGDEQRRQLDDQSGRLVGEGRQDAARPLGEDRIFPDVPPETLRAQVPGSAGAAAGAPAAGQAPGAAGLDADSLSAVTTQERGPQIQAGVAQGGRQMATGKQDKDQNSGQARADTQAQITQEIQANTDQQTAQRAAAKEQAQGRRAEWRTEQDNLLDENRKKADEEHTGKRTGILRKKTDTDGDVQQRKDADNQRITTERRRAESDARKKRQEKKEESRSWFSKAVSAVKSAFNALLNAIKTVFDAAVNAINKIKDEFKKAINGLIDLATKAIVGLIKALATALIAISGVLLAAFPGLRDKFRKFIEDLRDAAIAKVQQFADNLKKAVNKLIDALAGALVGLLRLYEKALLAAVAFVRDAVVKALQFVENAIKLMGEFAALVKDIAPDPIGWIKKLGTAAKDGIRSYLWGAVKTAVRQWFNDKVESVLGLGKLIWNVLIKGCLSVAQIGKMAWQAIVKALPMMIITLVIEKVVSLIIPAAGAILTIVQGLIAAYGTVSRIIAAFAKFFTFLKSVKSGGAAAACNFAQAVAAGVVALLEFITNFLLARIGRALKGVGGRLKGIAQKIMKGLKRGAKGARKAAGRAVNAGRQALRTGAQAVRRGATRAAQAVRRGVTTGARAVRTGARRVGTVARQGLRRAGARAGRALTSARNALRRGLHGVRRATRALGRRLARTKVGRALANGARRARDAYRRMRDRLRAWRQRLADRRRQRQEDKKKKPQESKEARLQRILVRIRPRLDRLLRRGVRQMILVGVLGAMRLWYRLTSLQARSSGATQDIWAQLNPGGSAGRAYEPSDAELRAIIREAVRDVLGNTDVRRSASELRRQEEAARAGGPRPHIGTGVGIPGAVRRFTRRGSDVGSSYRGYTFGGNRLAIGEFHPGGNVANADPRNARVNWIGTYPSIANKANETVDSLRRQAIAGLQVPGLSRGAIQDLRQMKQGNVAIATAMRQFIVSGSWPGGFSPAEQNRLGRLTFLMHVRESVRDPENVALAPMTLDLIEKGHLTFEEAFAAFERPGNPSAPWRTGGGGLYPASMVGAYRATRGMEAERAGRDLLDRAEEERISREGTADERRMRDAQVAAYGTADERRDLELRKTDIISAWIEMNLKSGGGVWGASRNDIVVFIRRFISRYYGVTSR
ncbi:MAG TPA: hypothetical protein VFU43_30130 [Streptosporangiaceae bacterium]|nr:hypothetical protein [Streptosporangiaceae bacterium]